MVPVAFSSREALALECVPVPISFRCPITHEVMLNPVATHDGHVYDRNAILQWFQRGNRRSPMTGKELPSLALRDEVALRQAIEEYISYRPNLIRKELDLTSLETAAATLESELACKAVNLDEFAKLQARAEMAEDALLVAEKKLQELEQEGQTGECPPITNASEYIEKMRAQRNAMVEQVHKLELGHVKKDQKIRELQAAVAVLESERSSREITFDAVATWRARAEKAESALKMAKKGTNNTKKKLQQLEQEKENITGDPNFQIADCNVRMATLQNAKIDQTRELTYVEIAKHRGKLWTGLFS